MANIAIGHSPDPDDAYMFYAMAKGAVTVDGYDGIDHVMADIQTLNERAMRGELEVTAISAHCYPHVADRYRIMSCGASMGLGYGPIVVSKTLSSIDELKGKRLATPGKMTTALLIAGIFLDDFETVDTPFDKIMDVVDAGEVDAGLLIHEGQLTYKDHGFTKLLDFGELWAEETGGLPLPLGLDCVRRDVGEARMQSITNAMYQSIVYADAHFDDAVLYAQDFGRGIDLDMCGKFTKMYVNELTLDMGEDGRRALSELFARATAAGAIAANPAVDIITADRG